MIRFENIGYTPPSTNRAILRGINVRIHKGKLTAIMGLNGSGKTTVLNVMSGLIKPTHGHVMLGDVPLNEYSSRERARNLAHVPQDFHTEFPFMVSEVVQMGRFAWQDGGDALACHDDIVRDTLETLGLEKFAARPICTLSGGERQRVLMARMLVQNTPVISLDEPLNHLDIKNKKFVLDLLTLQNRESGKTIVAVLHDLHDAINHFDDVILLKNGSVVFAGPVHEGLSPELVRHTFETDWNP